jgi:hypothetical protein
MFKIYFPLEIIMFGEGIASCTLKEHISYAYL